MRIYVLVVVIARSKSSLSNIRTEQVRHPFYVSIYCKQLNIKPFTHQATTQKKVNR